MTGLLLVVGSDEGCPKRRKPHYRRQSSLSAKQKAPKCPVPAVAARSLLLAAAVLACLFLEMKDLHPSAYSLLPDQRTAPSAALIFWRSSTKSILRATGHASHHILPSSDHRHAAVSGV